MNELRFGVVGCGMIHGTHCKAINELPNAVLAGVYDVVPERARKAAETFGTQAFDTQGALFEAADAITICVPSGLHAKVGVAAAAAGKHVLSEKPIDVTLDRARSMIDACSKASVQLGVISQHRFAPDVIKVREMVQRGQLGKILQCDVYVKWYRTQSYYDSAGWRGTHELDGGCMLNQGIHYIDLGQWIMGGAETAQCTAETLCHKMEAEDTALAILKYKNGARGLLQITTNAYPGFAERLEIHGEIGSVVIEGDVIRFCEIDPDAAASGFYGKGVTSHPVPPAESNEAEPPEALWDTLHRSQIADFVGAVLHGHEPALPGREAIRPLAVIRACYESSANGGVIVPVAQ